MHTTSIVLALAALLPLCSAVLVTINNNASRVDSNGTIMDAHDGPIQIFTAADGEKYYYIHAVSYGLCLEPPRYGCDQTADHCGFQPDHNISVWRSKTMANGSWESMGFALTPDQRPPGTLFRPDIVYNPNTHLYVMWWNYVALNGTYMGYAAATSSQPEGPFTLQVNIVNLTRNNATSHAGDYHLFVEDDGTGYVIYSANFWMSIEKLTPDFLASTGVASPLFSEYFIEAPVLFKRNGLYYALFDHCCCFCEQGSGILVHTATSPLGPWTTQASGDLACAVVPGSEEEENEEMAEVGLSVRGIPTPGQGCLYNAANQVSNTASQQNYVVQVLTPTGIEYVWTGDRWQQAPDGIKGHEPQFWIPLAFNADGTIQNVNWVNNFTMDVAPI